MTEPLCRILLAVRSERRAMDGGKGFGWAELDALEGSTAWPTSTT